jgi:uncharacterized membrane protein
LHVTRPHAISVPAMTTTPDAPESPPKPRLRAHLRTYFLTGIVVTAPIAITLWAAYWFVTLIDRWIKPLLPDIYNPDHYLPFTVPGVGLVFALVVITFIGAFAANLVGRTILGLWERALNRTPFVRSIYKGTKQLFQTVLSQTGTTFREVALIEWPRKGVWALVFVSREIDGAQIGLEPGRRMYSVYVSTTPNPTGGYVMFLDAADVHIIDMPVDDALKLVISMGLVIPETSNVAPDQARKLLAKRRKS